MGLQAEFREASLAQCQDMLRSGEIDLGPSLLRNPERETYVHFLEPPFRSKIKHVFYVRKGSRLTIVKYDDLRHNRIGVSQAKNFDPFDTDTNVQKRVEKQLADGFKALCDGQVDAFLTCQWMGDWFLRHSEMRLLVEQAAYHRKEYHPAYLTMSKKSPLISRATEFETQIDNMIKDGTIRRIVEKYIPGQEHFYEVRPEDVGMSSERLQGVQSLADRWIQNDQVVGGVILVARHDRIVFHEAFGWSDRKHQLPMEEDSICLLGSMTKPLTGTAILMLLEEGKLSLHDRVSKYLSSFDNAKSRNITIFQLLTHTAGFSWEKFEETSATCRSLAQAVDRLGAAGPAFEPGTKFLYTSYGYSVLGMIVEKVAGVPVEGFIKNRILDPLEMNRTFCTFDPKAEWAAQVASRYEGQPGQWKNVWNRTMPPDVPYFTSATGLFSTTQDYQRLMSLMLHRGKAGGRQLLAPSTVRMALNDHASYVFDPNHLRTTGGPFEYNRYWGLDWWVFLDKYGAMRTPVATGSFSIYGITGAFALADPTNDLVCILLTQTQVNQPDIFRPLIHAVYAALESAQPMNSKQDKMEKQ
jgi:CubicO group peptidase (beta-lactamase class C family)